MASFVIQNRIGLRLNNHTTTPLPKKFAANQLTRTGNRVASEKVGRNVHAEQTVSASSEIQFFPARETSK